MGKINVGVIGVGNCFAGLVQGIEYYKQNPDKKIIGIMHDRIGDYNIFDIEFTSAFDVSENKIGKTLDKAICLPMPHKCTKASGNIPETRDNG